jgi:hypothetical protein
MPASAAAASPEVMPGMMRKRMPALGRAEASSQPRPNTKASPPFRRNTRRPERARSISTSLISRCFGEGRPPRLPAAISSASARASFSTRASTSASCTMVVGDRHGMQRQTVSRRDPGAGACKPDLAGRKIGGRKEIRQTEHERRRRRRKWRDPATAQARLDDRRVCDGSDARATKRWSPERAPIRSRSSCRPARVRLRSPPSNAR